MAKEMLFDDSFLKDVKSNALVRTIVSNWLQDIPIEAPLSDTSVATESTEPLFVPAPTNKAWANFDVSTLHS